MSTNTSTSTSTLFSRSSAFWANYTKGRPPVPPSFWDRIFLYHAAHSGQFSTAHDLGAGNGVHSSHLRSRFSTVIVSDLIPENTALARQLLCPGGDSEKEGFTFRAADLSDTSDIPRGSVDLVLAANVMHFADPQEGAMQAVAYQLKSGGTFAAALFGPARFCDEKMQDLWERVSYAGGKELLRVAGDVEKTVGVMARTQGRYDVAPLDPGLFLPGGRRIYLNMGKGGIQGMLPPEEAQRNKEPSYVGVDDVEVFEEDEGWKFEMDLKAVKEHFGSFPFISQFPEAFTELYQELEGMKKRQPFKGHYPVTIILATRR